MINVQVDPDENVRQRLSQAHMQKKLEAHERAMQARQEQRYAEMMQEHDDWHRRKAAAVNEEQARAIGAVARARAAAVTASRQPAPRPARAMVLPEFVLPDVLP